MGVPRVMTSSEREIAVYCKLIGGRGKLQHVSLGGCAHAPTPPPPGSESGPLTKHRLLCLWGWGPSLGSQGRQPPPPRGRGGAGVGRRVPVAGGLGGGAGLRQVLLGIISARRRGARRTGGRAGGQAGRAGLLVSGRRAAAVLVAACRPSARLTQRGAGGFPVTSRGAVTVAGGKSPPPPRRAPAARANRRPPPGQAGTSRARRGRGVPCRSPSQRIRIAGALLLHLLLFWPPGRPPSPVAPVPKRSRHSHPGRCKGASSWVTCPTLGNRAASMIGFLPLHYGSDIWDRGIVWGRGKHLCCSFFF